MILYRLLTKRYFHGLFKRTKTQNCFYKYISEYKTLSSIITEAWCACNFLDLFRDANEHVH